MDRCPVCNLGLRSVRGRTPAILAPQTGKPRRCVVRLHECLGCGRLVVEETADEDVPRKRKEKDQ